ncbi:MAG: prolipoprotein diacylglyceryl transferase, partial [Hydrotalea sp.]|nr:prolipoprotein diacylglyceryl transferase [Hydrotalea sp.]
MAYLHQLNPIAFHVFGWPIYWYGLAYMAGFLFCRYWVPRCYNQTRAVMAQQPSRAAPMPNLAGKDWDDFLFYGILATLVGGRLGFILLYHRDYFFHLSPVDWWQWFAVWQGGMAFHGAAVGLFIASLWFCRQKKIDPWLFVDNFTRAVPMALFVGRLANFINGELVGRVITNDFWRAKIGVVFPLVDDQPRYPSQLFEAMFEGLILFALLHVLASYKNHLAKNFKKGKGASTLSLRLPHGIVFCGFLFFYGLFRFCVEFLRDPQDGYIGPLTAGQFWCLIMAAAGVGIA